MGNETITTQSMGLGFVAVNEEFVLVDTPQTKTVFKAEIHTGGIRGRIIRYKKSDAGDCDEIIPIKFNQLHANDGVKIELPTEAVDILYRKFEELRQLLEKQGIRYGEHKFSITDGSSLVVTDQNKAIIIRKLLEKNLGEDIWAQIAHSDPDIATRLAHAKLQSDRIVVLRQFEKMLNNNSLSEDDWQDFFEGNKWIFGYGLRYQILRVLQSQPNYGGTELTGRGGQRGDFLVSTDAEVKFTCLIEIKKPSTQLLQNSAYRNGVWGASSELSGAISQVQVNCAKWEIEGSRTDQNREFMDDICTVSPRGIVVIGRTGQLDNRDKKNSFERFRREMHNPEIITFDELYERAKYILGEPIISADVDDSPF